MAADAVILLTAGLVPLAIFALGYLAVLAAPGPNMLAIGTIAALRGFRGSAPFCLGIASGAGALAASLCGATGMIAGDSLADIEHGVRIVGAMLLLVIAMRVIRTPRPVLLEGPSRPVRRISLEAFGAGFLTAATNPITGTFFLAQFVGPLAQAGISTAAVVLVPLQALAVAAGVSMLFARPGIRNLAIAHHRGVCIVAGLALAVLAAATLRSVLVT